MREGNALLAKLRAVALTEEDDAVGTTLAGAAGAAAPRDKRDRPAAATATPIAAAVSAQPAWMVAAGAKAQEWLALLPKVRRASVTYRFFDPVERLFIQGRCTNHLMHATPV